MPTVRIAVASTPLTRTLSAAVPAAIEAVEEAGRRGAQIVCLPETGLPGHRCQPQPVAAVTQAALDEAVADIAEAGRLAGVATIIGTERPLFVGREILSVVFDAGGHRLGEQVKTQIDPTEEIDYVAGQGRRIFTIDGLTFGVAICHEAFRYPEISRSLALAGAQVIFAPHFVTTEGAPLPAEWGAPTNPYNETALRLRAMENTVFVAAANCSGPDQGSITGVIDPAGRLVASLPYGETGVAIADIDPVDATAFLAHRWAPERNAFG